MRYGDGGTIHHTQHLHVEVDSAGKVVAVWFRCMALPFDQSVADSERAEDMRRMYGAETTRVQVGPLQAVILGSDEELGSKLERALAEYRPIKVRE